jgi:two-component system sensor histidine kinase AtoS
MKNKIISGLIVLSLCFLFGGFYITEAMNRVVSGLQDMIVLQEMGFQRQTLLAQIKTVQADLLLKDSPHAADFGSFVQHGESVGASIDACHQCHHPEFLLQSMQELRGQVDSYLKRASSAFTLSANAARLNDGKQRAFREGELLLREVGSMFSTADQIIAARTAQARQVVAGTRGLLISFVVIGPLIILAGAIFFLSRFTHAITALSTAISRVKGGNLEYRITEQLNDEFRDLAEAFNEMGASLKAQRRRIEMIQRRYRILFESAADAIFVLEAEGKDAGKIVSANKAAADMHGYSIEELLTMHIADLDVCEDAVKIPDRIRSILSGAWIKKIINHRRKDGTIFPLEISAGLMEYDGRKYILAFDRDITERVQTEEALQRSKQLAMVGQMAAGLAHEIKNPLAGIKVSMEVLSSELEMAQEDREVLVRVINEVNRIEILLRNVLEYARPPKPEFFPCDIKRLLDVTIKNAELSLKSPAYAAQKEKYISFIRELDDSLPVVMADSSKLLQIFLNLFLNSIEASPGGGTITVRACLVESGDGVQITVADTGKGLDADTLARIFQPFYTTKPKGSGLGLAITKRLVEQHQGSIEVVSQSGQGTTFTITLPLEQTIGQEFI